MTINLAVTDRRSSLKYKNQTQTWDWLEARCQSPIRTTETEEEYPKLPKTKQAELKDQGGFVPGILRNGSRKIENVAALSFGMLDGDHIPSGVSFADSVLSALPNNLWFAHTTHSHTQPSQRYRLAVAFSRNVQPDEYPPLMRKIAEKIGMNFFDPCSFEINRMMYWPSCPANGVFDFQKNDGEPANVEAILAEYEDWRDVSRWPVSVRQSEVITRSLKQQQDPLTKKGVIGAFCRAYSAQDAIDTFLSDVYEPSIMSGRYDYIPADSASGVVIYDDKYVFSHHASDPACGKLLNAFDLVRVHKFGSADDKASFSAMSDFAVKDQRVNLMITDERLDQAKQDFTNDDDWKTHLERMPRSTLLANSLKNILLILTYDVALQGIRYNLLCHQIYVKGALPWERDTPSWRDADTAQLVAYVDANYGTFSARNYELAMAKVTDDRKYNPICDYLNSLPLWDGVQRVDTLLVDYLNAPDTPYVRAVTRKTLAAAVARVFVPGIKYDSMLVMDGPQEKGKSTLFNRLTGDAWYNDGLTLVDMQDKAGAEKMQGYWIMEIAELAGMKKSDIDCVKAFLSRRYDKYRPSYGRTVEDHPRQTIIVATVNGMGGYLRDPTGNRRFWPVKTPGGTDRKAWEIPDYTVSQIWAESLFYWSKGEKLFLEGEIKDMATEEQMDAMEIDPREGIVGDYLEKLLPLNWDNMDAFARRGFMQNDGFLNPVGTVQRECVCPLEVWVECFGKDQAIIKRQDSYEITTILRALGWVQLEKAKRIPQYGLQRLWRHPV